MRIVLVSDFFYPRVGGIPNQIYWLSRQFAEMHHEVLIVTTAGKRRQKEIMENITIIRLPYTILRAAFSSKNLEAELLETIRELKPDIIHAHHAFSPLGVLSGKIGFRLGISSILTNHSIPPDYSFFRTFWKTLGNIGRKTIYRDLLYYDTVIAVSPIAADFISCFYRGPIYLIPNGIDLEKIQKIESSRDEFGYDEKDFIIIHVGRPSLRKGFEITLLVARLLKKFIPNLRILLIGPRGSYKTFLLNNIERFDINDIVEIIDFLPWEQTMKLYKIANLLLHPSVGEESFGIIFLEAMACGLPIVAAGCRSVEWIIRLTKSGIHIDMPKPSTIAKVILSLYRNPQLRSKFSKNGKKNVKFFDIKRIAKKHCEIYRRVLYERKRSMVCN